MRADSEVVLYLASTISCGRRAHTSDAAGRGQEGVQPQGTVQLHRKRTAWPDHRSDGWHCTATITHYSYLLSLTPDDKFEFLKILINYKLKHSLHVLEAKLSSEIWNNDGVSALQKLKLVLENKLFVGKIMPGNILCGFY